MNVDGCDHIALRIVSQPRYLCVVRAMIEAATERLGFDDASRGMLVLAVDEAVTNVMRHGYNGAEDGHIWVRFMPLDNPPGLQLVIEDACRQVDPAKIAGRMLEDVRPGGLGVHIMRQVMDDVTIEPRAEGVGMCLTMRKFLRPVADGSCNR